MPVPPAPSPVAMVLGALAAKLAGVPGHVPVYALDWTELGADSVPADRHTLAYGAGMGDVLAAALAADVRSGRIVAGCLVDRRTGEVLAEHPAP